MMKKYEIGDIISDRIKTIMIERIKPGSSFNNSNGKKTKLYLYEGTIIDGPDKDRTGSIWQDDILEKL